MKTTNFPFEDYLFDAKDEEIIWIKGKAFLVKPATEEDIERIGKGYFAMGIIEKMHHYHKTLVSTRP